MKIKHQFTDLHKDSKKRSKICLLCASLCMFTFIIRKSKCSRISKRKVHFTKRNV